jgi:hypothetical protein
VPLLTRRPDKDPHRKGWYVFFGDIRVGHIGERAGVPHDVDKWGWHCGFGPGCDTREMTSGTGKDLEEARVGFEAAWARLAPTKTEAHFELWRYQRDFTAWKYRMWDEKCQMPTQRSDGRSKCFCGAEITIASIPQHVREAHRGIGDKRPDQKAPFDRYPNRS